MHVQVKLIRFLTKVKEVYQIVNNQRKILSNLHEIDRQCDLCRVAT